ncbi:MAG TPA: prolyl oligopeptidase family serine peptidase [bacterium]|nr:prolyl oligopeptidase family serine peptidase [Candidatus Omnitrophota bacterium]HOL93023.1 prolyl oligopeptidase family serine peptidase [bacterium]HPO99240.1 prolyl oligopeptidase family serine peptidase [bacterium]HXK93303.1 prolyl oligopeptidase family serine peptidase [bacterium]
MKIQCACAGWPRVGIGVVLAGLLSMVNISPSFAQLAKIQRKTAQLTVHPPVVAEGRAVTVLVRPFDKNTLLRASLIQPSGVALDRALVSGTDPVVRVILHAPADSQGMYKVVLEAQRSGHWIPVAEESVVLLPNCWKDLQEILDRARAVEEKAGDSNPSLIRAAWAVLAAGEDLMERLKLAGTGDSWDLQRRLAALRTKVEKLEGGVDPFAQTDGYQLRGYRSPLNGEMQLYSLYVPKNYNPDQSWPLVVMLHGAWSNHHLALRRVMGKPNERGEDDARAKRVMPALPEVPYLVVAPNGFETMSYQGFAEDDVWRVISEVQALFHVDPERVYLTGLSMGGAGTMKLGLRYPDRFAAIAPVCGFVGALTGVEEEAGRPAVFRRLETCMSSLPIAENAFALPVKLMHGEADPVVPVKNSIALHDRLQELGYRVEMEIYPGVDHAAWVPAYENARIFEWFSQFRRDPAPRKVIYKSGDPQGGSSYWTTIEEPERIREFAQIEAKADSGVITVTTSNVQRFSLAVPHCLIPFESVAEIQIDGQTAYRGTMGERIRFAKADGDWKWTRQEFPRRLLPGMSGLDEAMEQRHVYVYGTDGPADAVEEARSLAVAKSLKGTVADVQWKVLPEDALSPEILKENNVVLFSTLSGSSFLKRHLGQLPLQAKNGRLEFAGKPIEANQGISFIYPNPANPERYVLINTASTLEGLKALRNFAATQRFIRLNASGDFVVFSAEGKSLWTGLFDKNWNVEVMEEL